MTELGQTVHTLALARVERAAGRRRALPEGAPNDRVPVAALYAAYERAFATRGDEVVDEVAGAMTLEQLGLLGFAALTAPSALAGLEATAEIYGLVTSDGRWRLEVEAERVRVTLERGRPSTLGRRLSDEAALAQLALGVRHAAVSPPRVVELTVRHRPLAPRALERHIGRRPLRSAEDAITFDRRSLEVPTRRAHDGMHAHFRCAAREAASALAAPTWTERATAAIEAALDAGHADGRRLAQALGVSLRTLQRRLVAEGRTLRELTGEVRGRRAEALLRQGATVEQVAERVGYADASAFHRAFTRWRGVSPGRLRAKSPARVDD